MYILQMVQVAIFYQMSAQHDSFSVTSFLDKMSKDEIPREIRIAKTKLNFWSDLNI
jgi:hypothetical protein